MSQIARNKNHALAWRLHRSPREKSHNGENAKMTSGMSCAGTSRVSWDSNNPVSYRCFQLITQVSIFFFLLKRRTTRTTFATTTTGTYAYACTYACTGKIKICLHTHPKPVVSIFSLVETPLEKRAG